MAEAAALLLGPWPRHLFSHNGSGYLCLWLRVPGSLSSAGYHTAHGITLIHVNIESHWTFLPTVDKLPLVAKLNKFILLHCLRLFHFSIFSCNKCLCPFCPDTDNVTEKSPTSCVDIFSHFLALHRHIFFTPFHALLICRIVATCAWWELCS